MTKHLDMSVPHWSVVEGGFGWGLGLTVFQSVHDHLHVSARFWVGSASRDHRTHAGMYGAPWFGHTRTRLHGKCVHLIMLHVRCDRFSFVARNNRHASARFWVGSASRDHGTHAGMRSAPWFGHTRARARDTCVHQIMLHAWRAHKCLEVQRVFKCGAPPARRQSTFLVSIRI